MITYHKGTSRAVVAIPELGVVIKFATIQFKNVWLMLKKAKRDHDRFCVVGDRQSFREFLRQQFFERSVEGNSTLKRFLFHGIVSNWRERRYYRSSDADRQQLLQPSYFSLLGLVNIQKYGKPMRGDGAEIYGAYFQVVGPALNEDGHHFFNSGNFHHSKEGVVFLDYGSLVTQKILSEHGSDILRRFVPPKTHAL